MMAIVQSGSQTPEAGFIANLAGISALVVASTKTLQSWELQGLAHTNK
jgi:hypothetical protein